MTIKRCTLFDERVVTAQALLVCSASLIIGEANQHRKERKTKQSSALVKRQFVRKVASQRPLTTAKWCAPTTAEDIGAGLHRVSY